MLGQGPGAGVGAAAGAPSSERSAEQLHFPDVTGLPQVSDILGTVRNRLEALNGEGLRRV